MKFGGTSVGSTSLINDIAASIVKRKQEEKNIVIVVSAMGKSTDHLISLAKEITPNLDKREIDALLATGEQQTIALLTIALKHLGQDAISLTGFQAGFKTTASHTKGIIIDVNVERVQSHLKEGKVVVVAGFQGMTDYGDITTLGRGGSDTSAVALAAKLGYACEIYTDVAGIYRVDPRLYKDAELLHHISFDELMEMASLGAGVIETRSVELAKKFNVPLYIAKSLSKKGSGTYIMNENYMFEEKPITGLSITNHVAMVTLEQEQVKIGSVTKVFQLLGKENISLDMISQTIDKNNALVLSFSIEEEDVSSLEQVISDSDLFNEFKLSIRTGLVKISLVGVGMASNFGVAAKAFTLLQEAGVSYHTVSTSEISISCTIDEEKKQAAVEALSVGFRL